MAGQQGDEIVEDVLDEILSDDDDDEDNIDVVQGYAIENVPGVQPGQQQEPGDAAPGQGMVMDVDMNMAGIPDKPTNVPVAQRHENNTRASNIDSEPPIEGYAR